MAWHVTFVRSFPANELEHSWKIDTPRWASALVGAASSSLGASSWIYFCVLVESQSKPSTHTNSIVGDGIHDKGKQCAVDDE